MTHCHTHLLTAMLLRRIQIFQHVSLWHCVTVTVVPDILKEEVQTSWLWRWRYCNCLKCQVPGSTHPTNTVMINTWFFSSSVVQTSILYSINSTYSTLSQQHLIPQQQCCANLNLVFYKQYVQYIVTATPDSSAAVLSKPQSCIL